MANRIFDYCVVCGDGPEIRTLDGEKGYHGTGSICRRCLISIHPHSLSSATSAASHYPVCEDIIEAYRIPANSYADKWICLVSRSPSFHILRDAGRNIRALFLPSGNSKPLWDVVAYLVSNVPLPTPGKDRVLFAIENSLVAAEVPPKDGLPDADISFKPLIQCLDVDELFTAVLLERRILLRSNKYSLLTLVSEAICHLICPFRWQ